MLKAFDNQKLPDKSQAKVKQAAISYVEYNTRSVKTNSAEPILQRRSLTGASVLLFSWRQILRAAEMFLRRRVWSIIPSKKVCINFNTFTHKLSCLAICKHIRGINTTPCRYSLAPGLPVKLELRVRSTLHYLGVLWSQHLAVRIKRIYVVPFNFALITDFRRSSKIDKIIHPKNACVLIVKPHKVLSIVLV